MTIKKYEQSIEQYVTGHNVDINAHQVYGSSLYMHKSNPLLDHPLGSVDLKKLISKQYCSFYLF